MSCARWKIESTVGYVFQSLRSFESKPVVKEKSSWLLNSKKKKSKKKKKKKIKSLKDLNLFVDPLVLCVSCIQSHARGC